MKKTINILCLIFLISSCYRELDFSNVVNNTVVVSSFVANDSLIKVNLLKAMPVNEVSQKVYITDALVKLYENDVFMEDLVLIDSTYSNGDSYTIYYYRTKNTRAKVGKTYQLKITTAEGKLISSETFIPEPVEIITIDTTFHYTINLDENFQEIEEIFKIRFKDPIGTNFYRITMTTRQGYTNGNKIVYVNERVVNFFYPYLDSIFSYFSEDDNNSYSGTKNNNFLIFNDQSINGQEYELYLKNNYGTDYYGTKKGEFTQYIIELQSLTKEGYDYLRSIDLQTQSSGILEPEPVMAYSNIENGVGIFAGYSASQKIITIGEYPIEGFTYE